MIGSMSSRTAHFFHEYEIQNISLATLTLEGHLSVIIEKVCTKYWSPASERLVQDKCGYLTDLTLPKPLTVNEKR